MPGRLEALLEEKKQHQEREQVNRVAERKDWINTVADLLNRIQEWLKPLEERKYLQIDRRESVIREDLFGQYTIDRLLLKFVDGQSIEIQPIGRYVVGAQGRVDLKSGPRTVMIVHRGGGTWELAEREGRGKPKTWPFNRETLEELLADLIEES